MRLWLLLTPILVATAAPTRSAQSQPPYLPCPQCIPVVSAVSTTSLSIATAFAPGGAIPNATTNNCVVKYTFGNIGLHSVTMTKSATGFSASIVAIPPGTVVQHRVACEGHAGSFRAVKTLAATGPAPSAPVIVSAKLTSFQQISFSFTSDPSEPTVFWIEIRPGADGQWDVVPDMVDTFSVKNITVGIASKETRIGVRNSAGTVYSASVQQ